MQDFNFSLVGLADRNQRVNTLVFTYAQDFFKKKKRKKEIKKSKGKKNLFQITAFTME